MATQRRKPIKVKLTDAQVFFAAAAVHAAIAKGDCEASGHTLSFPDYEGAMGFFAAILEAPTRSYREYTSQGAILHKVHGAVAASVTQRLRLADPVVAAHHVAAKFRRAEGAA